MMGLLNEEKISLPIIVRGSYTAPKGDADALHSFERRKSDGFGGRLSSKINEKLKEIYNAGINPDITQLNINIDSTSYSVNWEATIDESKNGMAYMGISTRGSAGKNADKRAERQIDNLERELKRNGGEDVTLVLDFKNPSGVYIRQFFFKYTRPKEFPPKEENGDYVRTLDPTTFDSDSELALVGGTESFMDSSTLGKYQDCDPLGELKKWCKDSGSKYQQPNIKGIIYTVQGCIGASQDGYFGPKTEKKLKEKIGKITFNPNDLEKICKNSKMEQENLNSDNIENGSSNFMTVTKKVINNFEGGYWNPYCSSHPKQGMGKSTETMFGLDRYNGDIESSPEGQEFFKIIDDDKKLLGATQQEKEWSNMGEFCKKWKWLYRGGDKESRLKELASSTMKRRFDKYMDSYIKDPETKQKIMSNDGLLIHMSYATWNGSGNFRKFANNIEKAVKQGKSDKELIDVAISSRNERTGAPNKEKVENGIRNPNSLVG